jgi:hypothetical protein
MLSRRAFLTPCSCRDRSWPGCRLRPDVVGTGAGLVAFGGGARTTARAVRNRLAAFQRDLRADGVLLEWPDA